MMSNISSHISTIGPPLNQAEPIDDIITIIWWPNISISALREIHRIDDIIPDVRIRHAVRTAIQTALIDLSDWQAEKIAEGYDDLESVPAITVDAINILCHNWTRAIMALAKCELIEIMRDYDATASGARDNDYVDNSIMELRRDAQHAIRDIKKTRRTFVELI